MSAPLMASEWTRLPAAVTQQGVRVDKARANFLLFTILSSDNPDIDPVALGDYAARSTIKGWRFGSGAWKLVRV